MAHIYLSAAHKSSGKTTTSIGLCAALSQRKLSVQAFKKGPDYIDPMWLHRATSRPCYNLDFYTMSPAEIDARFAQHMQDTDIGIIEGNKGLFDGLALDGSNSNAALAQQLNAPVILVIDTRGMTRGIAPLVLGYQNFEPKVDIRGVILNRVGGARHESKLRQVLEHYTDVQVLGAMPNDPTIEITERHLGLQPSNEAEEADVRIRRLGDFVTKHVDLDSVAAIADAVPVPPYRIAEKNSKTTDRIRIGIARDEAFGFYYSADLEAMRREGAELVPFDTLKDTHLPAVDGLFIGGGFPEVSMKALEANREMRSSIRQAIEAGMPVYAECGGLMYLTRQICWKGDCFDMVGALAADTVMHERPQGRGYIRVTPTADMPWPFVAAQEGPEIQGHEFHYSSLENMDPSLRFGYEVRRGHGVDGKHDGIVYRNVFASYSHLSHSDMNPWVTRFLDFVRSKALPYVV